MPAGVEPRCAGTTERLVVPCDDVSVSAIGFTARYPVDAATELPEGEYLLRCRPDAPSTVDGTACVRFTGPATVEPTDSEVAVSFSDSTTVTLGVGWDSDADRGSITVAPTPDGVATAVTAMASAHHTTAPARSHPSFRAAPPSIEVGDETTVPDRIESEIPETGIEFRVPRSLDAVFVAAPLAYYLGAEVIPEDRERPLLAAPSAGVRREFGGLPDFQGECADMLRRTFFLDCLTRRVSPERDLLDPDGSPSLDPESVRSLSPADRLARYLEVPDEDLSSSLPDWHLSTYAAPEPDRVPCLPHLLDRLSLIYLPAASELEATDLLDETLTDAYLTRGHCARSTVLKPEPGAGRVSAWLAPGTPIDAFKASARAYENRSRARTGGADELRVAVVLNEAEMRDERATVADVYDEGAAGLPIDVTVHEELTRSELAGVFETEHDFVHYIGHCEDDGLRCADGTLDVADLDAVRTPTFFLNACGSYEQGLELIDNGAVAGAATLKTVLDRQAATVGTAFARLLTHGFSIQRALDLARRRIMMGKDYATVGDGTFALLPGQRQPVVARLETADEGYRLSCDVLTVRSNGARYALPFDDGATLNGTRTERVLSEGELREALADASLPVVHEGDLKWSDEIVECLE
ncbi:hypothetical protein [Halomicrobium salinisoli]|uniref:hypothetical protein n=1 Tax=Halomicrobium salinisoli TaxID=2878391 RepID=UPI001CF027B9|nr:hypothetical protein [Halomicrobium salinisoli]